MHHAGLGGCPARLLQRLQGDGNDEAYFPADSYLSLPLLSVFPSNLLTCKEAL